jgi:hypothetical protein
VSLTELRSACHRLGLGLTPEQVASLFRIFDADHNGFIERQELAIALMNAMREQVQCVFVWLCLCLSACDACARELCRL